MSATHEAKAGSPFVGTWRNTNPTSRAMAQLTFATDTGGLTMRVDGDTTADCFETPVAVFVDDDAATATEKILARQDLAWGDLVLHGWIKQGVLVLAIFRRFKTEEGRSNYFDREFFYRADRSL